MSYETKMKQALDMMPRIYREEFRQYLETGDMDPRLFEFCHTDSRARAAKDLADDAAFEAYAELSDIVKPKPKWH